MSSKPLFIDIAGAPFKIGERVRVVAGIDETFEEGFLGRLGTIEYFEYDCGCGQTFPSDPMIGVRFSNCIEEFWTEELQVVERVN